MSCKKVPPSSKKVGLYPAPHPEGERVEERLHNAYRAGNAAFLKYFVHKAISGR